MENTSPPYDARVIANTILDIAESQDRALSLISLMKLVYFAHGLHLTEIGAPLVVQEFEAWEYGPVVRVVWDGFKNAGGQIPVGKRAMRFLPQTGSMQAMRSDIDQSTRTFLEGVFTHYGHIPAFGLVAMTHDSNSPWEKVWNATSRANLGMRISNELISGWFSSPALRH